MSKVLENALFKRREAVSHSPGRKFLVYCAGMESGTIIASVDGKQIKLNCQLTERQRNILRAGGLLHYIGEGGV